MFIQTGLQMPKTSRVRRKCGKNATKNHGKQLKKVFKNPGQNHGIKFLSLLSLKHYLGLRRT